MAARGQPAGYTSAMDENAEQDVEQAVHDALNALATHLGGTSDTGGPVENATQIKGRGELGVLLTDVHNNVLGRVWLSFGGGLDTPGFDLSGNGAVHVAAEVCSERVDPPLPLEAWLALHPGG